MVWVLESIIVGIMMAFWVSCWWRLVPLKYDLNVSSTITTISSPTPPELRKNGMPTNGELITNGLQHESKVNGTGLYRKTIERY